MIKAIATITEGGETKILATGPTGDCLKVAREAGLKIKGLGDACVQVFSTGGIIYNDDGRKADYQRRLAAAENAAKAAPANIESDEKPAPKKVAKKAAKKVANKSTD
jgi:hypothetical protein